MRKKKKYPPVYKRNYKRTLDKYQEVKQDELKIQTTKKGNKPNKGK